jgi:hypothetical protein
MGGINSLLRQVSEIQFITTKTSAYVCSVDLIDTVMADSFTHQYIATVIVGGQCLFHKFLMITYALTKNPSNKCHPRHREYGYVVRLNLDMFWPGLHIEF